MGITTARQTKKNGHIRGIVFKAFDDVTEEKQFTKEFFDWLYYRQQGEN